MKLVCDVPEPSKRRKRGKSTYVESFRLIVSYATNSELTKHHSRVAQLEQKIDGIMSFLASNQSVQPNGPSPMTPESQFTHQTSPHVPENSITQPTQPAPRSTRSKSQAIFLLIPGFQLTAQEAATYLSVYMNDYAPNFPFVMIPPSANVHSLHAESPGLFWAIIAAVAPQPFPIQQGIRLWFRQYIADHMIVRQEKSLQLLQAILVHVAW